MTANGPRGGGRKSKGDRRYIASRLPVEYSERLGRAAQCTGQSVSDFIADAVIKQVRSFDFAAYESQELMQERLPLEKLA